MPRLSSLRPVATALLFPPLALAFLVSVVGAMAAVRGRILFPGRADDAEPAAPGDRLVFAALFAGAAFALGYGLFRLARGLLAHDAGAERALGDSRCPACGYDLRASPGRCPECGRLRAE